MNGSILKSKKGQWLDVRGEVQKVRFLNFRERVCNFSLGFRTIEPSDFFRPRSKVVLRSEGFVWVPILGVFDKLHEVGVLSYLFYSLFKCFVNG